MERVGAAGDGVAAGPVYVPGALPGERVLAAIAGDRGEARELRVRSPDRVAPACPHFGECGGCALQHWRSGPYLAWKAEQIRLALARERIETEIAAPFAVSPGSRRRLALHARSDGRGGANVGFKARGTWRLVPIDVCPVADPRLADALPALRRLAGPLFEQARSAPTLHVTLSETGLDVEVTGVERRAGALSGDARARVAAAAAGDFARVTLDGEPLYQARAPVVQVGRASVAPPPGAFLQAVPAAEAAMGAFVVDALSGAARVADLYCGVGAFALRLAETAAVAAFDISEPAVRALAAAHGRTPGLKPLTAEARDLGRRPVGASELKRIEAVVIDPPRAGAAAQHRELAASGVARVAGVSCNPATFARDARILTDAGFELRRVLPVDQFLWSPHVELVGLFERNGG